MHIETDRLIIRDFVHTDHEALWAIFGDAETMRHVQPYTEDETKEFLKSFCIQREPRGAYAAVMKDPDQLIGYLLFANKQEPEIYEIGWIFNRQHWGKGLAYEASKALIDYGFRTLKLHRVFAQTDEPVKSLGLMRKLGMKLDGVMRKESKQTDGTWKDLYICAILEEDYFHESTDLLHKL